MRSLTQNNFILILGLLSLFMASCAAQKPKSQPTVEVPGAPIIESPEVQTEEIVSPVEQTLEWSDDAKLCVVFGPGMARGLAHVGVLEILEENNVPIHCLIGVEMGSVVSVLYSLNKNLNKLQWQVFKLKEDIYLDYPIFSGIRSSLIKPTKFESLLKEYLGFTRLSDYALPVGVGVTEVATQTPKLLQRTPSVESVLASVVLPDIFENQVIEGEGEFVTGMTTSPYPVQGAYEMGATHVLVVDLLSDSFSANGLSKREVAIVKQFLVAKSIGRFQIQNANYIIRPKLNSYKFTDFDRRVEIIEAGKAAMQEIIPQLKQDLSMKRVQE